MQAYKCSCTNKRMQCSTELCCVCPVLYDGYVALIASSMAGTGSPLGIAWSISNVSAESQGSPSPGSKPERATQDARSCWLLHGIHMCTLLTLITVDVTMTDFQACTQSNAHHLHSLGEAL